MLMLYVILLYIENIDMYIFFYLLVIYLIVNKNIRKYDFLYIFKVRRFCYSCF